MFESRHLRSFLFKRKNNRGPQKSYRRSVRRRRYSIQPYDLVRQEGRACRTKGTRGYGKYLGLVVDGKTVVKRVDAVEVMLREDIGENSLKNAGYTILGDFVCN